MTTSHTESSSCIERFSSQAERCGIPHYMIPALLRYLIDRAPPGRFLTAVLQNDLMNALSCADSTNINCLKAYGMFLYNHAPSGSYGSRENVDSWLKRHVSDGEVSK